MGDPSPLTVEVKCYLLWEYTQGVQMLKQVFLQIVEWLRDVTFGIQSFGPPKAQLIPIRVEVRVRNNRLKTRR